MVVCRVEIDALPVTVGQTGLAGHLADPTVAQVPGWTRHAALPAVGLIFAEVRAHSAAVSQPALA